MSRQSDPVVRSNPIRACNSKVLASLHRSFKAVSFCSHKILLSPQPPEKRIAKRFRGSNEWQVGDLVAHQLLSGRLVILRVIGHHTDRGGRSPVCEFLDWVGTEVPDNRRLRPLSILKSNDVPSVSQFVIGRTSAKERPDKRLLHLGTNLNPEQQSGQYSVVLWRWFDRLLKENYGL